MMLIGEGSCGVVATSIKNIQYIFMRIRKIAKSDY